MIACTIGGNSVLVANAGFSLVDALENRSILTVTILDSPGTANYTRGQPVSFSDSATGLSYNGFVNTSAPTKLGIAGPFVAHVVTTMDKQYLLDKRTNSTNFLNRYAGDIVSDMATVLAPEGVTGPYATHRDTSAANFNQGILSGVTGASSVGDGDLELVGAGTTVTILEDLTADFATGTLTNMQAVSGQLMPITHTSLQLTATGSGTVYVVIWQGSQTIGALDSIMFDTWIDQSAGPGQIYFTCSDGSVYSQATGTDTTSYPGVGFWSRSISLPSFWNGKVINQFQVAISTGANGNFTTYFNNIRLASAPNSPFFNGVLNVPAPFAVSMSGFSSANTAIVQTYNPYITPQRTSPAYDISKAGLLKNTLTTWVATTPGKSGVTISVTSDSGATWQTCANSAAIPLIVAGMNLSSKTLQFREIFTSSDSDPSMIPSLNTFTATINPAAACTKTDAQYTAHLAADWNAGTLTNVSVVNNALTIIGYQVYGTTATFDNGVISYNGGSIATNANGFYILFASDSGAKHSHVRVTGPGIFTNLLFQSSMSISNGPTSPGLGSGQNMAGMTYLSPQFNSTDGTYGYCVMLTSTSTGTPPANVTHTFLSLLRGSAGGSVTTIVAPTELTGAALTTPGFASVKVVYSAGVHKIYSNNILVFQATDSTYTTAANIGFYGKDIGGGPMSYNSVVNFGGFSATYNVTGSGTFVSPSTSLTPVGTYGSSLVVWNVATASVLTNLTIETSIDGGSTWSFATNGAAIAGITAGTSMSGKSLVVRATLLSQVITNISVLTGLRVIVLGLYSASGTRSTVPLGIDTATRTNVGSGFGTGTDGQTYVQVGTATTNLTSNHLQIVNTSGNVFMIYGSRTGGDLEATVRFSLSASSSPAGMVLRYLDVNNYYLFSASTTTLTLTKRIAGTTTTLQTAAMALSTSTAYRMRFRVVGSGPVNVFGRVWADQTLEPTSWSVTATSA